MECLTQALNILIFEEAKSISTSIKAILRNSHLKVNKIKVEHSLQPSTINDFVPDILFLTDSKNYKEAMDFYRATFPKCPFVLMSTQSTDYYIADDILPVSELSAYTLEQAIQHNILLKRTNRQLNKVIERFELLAKATNAIVWDWELLKRRSKWMGSGLKTSLGYNEETITVDSTFWERDLHPDDKKRVTTRLNSFFIEKQLQLWEDRYRFKTKNNEYRHFYDRGHIIYENGIAIRMVGIMEDITERLELEQKLEEQLLLKQKQIAEAVVTAQEKERTEIGKELHDNVNQLLSAGKLFIDASLKDEQKRDSLLKNASEYITSAIEEIRSLSKVLHAPLINELGLCESISILADDIMMVNNINIEVDMKRFSEENLNENFKTTIYRIIQEQLTNILKHAKAENTFIKLSASGKGISVEIKDDGVGFDIKTKRMGVGLRHIQSRVSMYEGNLNIKSKPDKGTSLKIKFPTLRAAMLV